MKNKYKFLIGFVIGILIVGNVYAITTINSKDVSYSNTSSGLNSTDVQDAIDELFQNLPIIVSAYKYDSTTCITGNEDSCVKTECYRNKKENSCPSGTIINVKVNDNKLVRFHVMFDKGNTMIMQSQKNTIYNTAWYTSSNDNTKGPLTALSKLEDTTKDWTNVNDQTYEMGTTVFEDNAYTGCGSTSCDRNSYTLASRTAKARMITAQETMKLGCSSTNQSCPKWMYNYLSESTNFGGTVNDTHVENGALFNGGYYTMSALNSSSNYSIYIYYRGALASGSTVNPQYGARAVVEVSK